MDDINMILWNKLKKHRGHNVRIVSYGDLEIQQIFAWNVKIVEKSCLMQKSIRYVQEKINKKGDYNL